MNSVQQSIQFDTSSILSYLTTMRLNNSCSPHGTAPHTDLSKAKVCASRRQDFHGVAYSNHLNNPYFCHECFTQINR